MSGHVRPAGKNRWRVVVEAGKDPGTGKRRRIVRYVMGRKSEADDLLAHLTAEYKQGTYIQPSKITVGEWLDTWLETYKKVNLRPRTWESYEILVRLHIKPAIGALYLQELKPEHLQKLYKDKFDQGLSAQTIRHIQKVLHGALKQALINRLISRNVSEAVALPRLSRREIKTLSRDEQARFIEGLSGDRLRVAFLMLLGTGIRRGELLGLQWQDVDLESGTVSIRRDLVWTKEAGFVYQQPKTEKSKRIIPLPAVLIDELRRHKELMELEKHFAPDAPLFCTTRGTPIIPENFNRTFYRLCRRAGINNINLHALRHTFATRLLEMGENIKVIQELLGHSRISTTADIYSHVAPEIKRQAAEKINEVLSLGTISAPNKGSSAQPEPRNP